MSTLNQQKKLQKQKKNGTQKPGKKAAGFKNILAKPTEQFWPVLEDQQEISEIETLCKSLLPQLKLSKVSKKASSKKRKLQKKEMKEESSNEMEIDDISNSTEKPLQSVVFGINEVAKLLEKQESCCVVIDSTIDNYFMIQHLVIMCENQTIPVIMAPILKKVTNDILGFACAAMAFKKNQSQNELFSEFIPVVQKMYKKLKNEKVSSKEVFKLNAANIENKNESNIIKKSIFDYKYESESESGSGSDKSADPDTSEFSYLYIYNPNYDQIIDDLHAKVNSQDFSSSDDLDQWSDDSDAPKPKCVKEFGEYIKFSDTNDSEEEPSKTQTSKGNDNRYFTIQKDNDKSKVSKNIGQKRKIGNSSQSVDQTTSSVSYEPLKVKRVKKNENRPNRTKKCLK
ncbi:uncharacterized protein LOC106658230, partial [Trichogramma pretiosum]|uniref:uncharacterized protein LOC106658230 n=1 Tax=Trichogramma pretiosum TaxID=7493 RepID=UPI000C71B9BA